MWQEIAKSKALLGLDYLVSVVAGAGKRNMVSSRETLPSPGDQEESVRRSRFFLTSQSPRPTPFPGLLFS